MSRRIHVVINPAAGKPEPILHILNSVFRQRGVEWDVSITHEFGDATRQARAAAEGGADVILLDISLPEMDGTEDSMELTCKAIHDGQHGDQAGNPDHHAQHGYHGDH